MPDPETIAKDTVVSIDYRLTDDSGEELDASRDTEPLEYLHGHGQIVDGLEAALDGQAVGAEVQISVPPEDGYGVHEQKLVLQVPRSQFEFDVQVGMVLDAQDDKGGHMPFMVKEVGEEQVTLDGNHPLAGLTLNFEVKVVAVRAATEEELTHGHAHVPGCQHHH